MMLAKFSDLENKSVFITGGGSGIGAEITKAFIQQGAKVSFVQRSDAEHFCDKVEALVRLFSLREVGVWGNILGCSLDFLGIA